MKKILITGGMSGLGKELVYIALRKGYIVDVLDISFGDIGDINIPENLNYIEADISKINQDIVGKLNGIYDVVICNAGISLSGNFLEHSLEQNTKLMQINTLGHMELIRLLLKNHKINHGGSIATIASASEMLPFPVALGYAASKGALRAFSDAMRSFVSTKNISVSVVYPGPMPTNHVKYYGKKVEHTEKNKKKVQKIAKNIFKNILKRKRNIYPDFVSKMLAYFQLPHFLVSLDKIMYKTYKKEIEF